MATTSFDKSFVVNDTKASKAFLNALKNPQKVNVTNKDSLEDSAKKGLSILKQRLHHSAA